MKTITKTPTPRPVVVLHSGEHMCRNRNCKRVYRADKLDQPYCSDECKMSDTNTHRAKSAKKTPSDRRAFKLVAVVSMAIMIMLTSCHEYMTDRQIRSSMETFQSAIDSLHREQRAVMDVQSQLFKRYRVLYITMNMIDTNRFQQLSSNDSLEIRTQLLMCQISMDAMVSAMKTQSEIYNEIWHEINNMYVSIDELEYYCEQHNRDPESTAAGNKNKTAGFFVIGFFGVIIIGFLSIIPSIFIKKRKNGKSKQTDV